MYVTVSDGRPEIELLLCCARTIRPPEAALRIDALLQEGIDWEYLLPMAHRHGVAPLLYWNLAATSPGAVSEDALVRLRDHFRTNTLRNLFLTEELLRLVNALTAQGIIAVPYKGPTLAASAYGNLALREFHDLDILVHRNDVPKSKEVLASLGYRARYRLTHAQEAAFLRSQREHPFVRVDGKSIVELHWRITETSFSSLDTERLLQRLNQIPLGSGTVLNLSPEDTLLILCVHGSKHAWERLGWICDVAELVRQEDIEWDRVLERARAMGVQRMLILGLLLANDLLGAALPAKVAQEMRADERMRVLAERTSERLFRETHPSVVSLEGHEGAPAFHTLHLKVRETLRDKIYYCVRKATNLSEEDWALLPLPKFLFPFYYVLRPIRLTWKYVPKILRRFL